MVEIIKGTTNKPASSRQLIDFFTKNPKYNGVLYIAYPIIGTSEGSFPIDAIWVSQEKGLVAFSLIESKKLSNFEEEQDNIYNKLSAKLTASKHLTKKRNLQINITPVTFAPAVPNHDLPSNEEYLISNGSNLSEIITNIDEWQNYEYYEKLVSVIQSISSIRKGQKKREIKKEDSRGFKLQRLEDSIANLDNQQGKAVIETVEGVQRIRGLAGSGKTIVLALKAAYLHIQHPDWKIAVTFNTRSLKGQFKRLINTFVIEQSVQEPNWDNIHIIHAWGSAGGGDKNGIYYTFCQKNNVEYYDFAQAKKKFGAMDAFSHSCKKAIKDINSSYQIYDAILIDEAQDFSPYFLQICYQLLKQPKRLVYAYDELQNLNSQSLPSPEEIFGKKTNGQPVVTFSLRGTENPNQDIILEKCYRNSRPVLSTAHALGFGIYKEPKKGMSTGLVQMFENKNLWTDVGYENKYGVIEDNSQVTLVRTDASSPTFLENLSPIDDLIIFKCFENQKDQDNWLIEEIKKNIEEDDLRNDDIIVINTDPFTTKKVLGYTRRGLFASKINSILAGVDTSPDTFTDEDSVTFTGIYRAKGNEAGMVYIVNAQDCYDATWNLATLRNRLFTAITRSKGWVRVLGYGKDMESLIKEYEQVKENNFALDFRYPTPDERKLIATTNRDMTEAERRNIERSNNDFALVIKRLETGELNAEDIDFDTKEKLKKFLFDSE